MSPKSTSITISLSTIFTLLHLSFNFEHCYATTIDTTSDNQYQGQTISCTGNECTIRCDKTSACESATINCANNKPCSVTCSYEGNWWSEGGDYNSCQSATINCPTSNSDPCSLTCSGYTDRDGGACNNVNIQWNAGATNTLTCDRSCVNVAYPPPASDSSPVSIDCNTNYECFGTIITCPTDAQCTINCSGTSSCENTVINCPNTDNCNVACTSTDSCKNAVINWSPTTSLGSLTCSSADTCLNVAPPPIYIAAPDDNSAFTVTCGSARECVNAEITCPTNADCTIICSATSACELAHIQCPVSGGCFMTCSANSACKNADIEWTEGQINSLVCATFDSVCYGVHFKPYQQNVAWEMDCTGANNMCYGAVFDCPQNADCTINCAPTTDVTYTCYAAVINGPINHALTVNCHQDSACENAHLHGEYASFLTLNCLTTGSYTCTSQSIWFPPKVGNTKQSYIAAPDDSFSDGNGRDPQLFYALNGWADVDINHASNKNWAYHVGTMSCNIGYVQSCAFASNSFACDGNGDNCDNPVLLTSSAPTKSPSKYPTVTPTSQPTTMAAPTVTPTIPTSQPTTTPTVTPTSQPSQTPTTTPTKTPSTQPTETPTQTPTNTPTTAETITPTTQTSVPTQTPTTQPSQFPSKYPTNVPSANPSIAPSQYPSLSPTKYPSKYPSVSPSKYPSKYPSDIPSIAPTMVSASPVIEPTEMPTVVNALPTVTPTVDEAGVDDKTTTTMAPIEDTISENDSNEIGFNLDRSSLMGSPIFFTVFGCIIGCLLFACIGCIYWRVQKRKRDIESIKHTFGKYNAEIAMSTSNVMSQSPSDNDEKRDFEGPRQTSVSLNELDPTDTNPNLNWESNPHMQDAGDYGSYHPKQGALSYINNNQIGSLSSGMIMSPAQTQLSLVNDTMINSMANQVNTMINMVTLGGPESPQTFQEPNAMEPKSFEEGPNLNFEAEVGSVTSVNNLLMDDIVHEMDTPQFEHNIDLNEDGSEEYEDDDEVMLIDNGKGVTLGQSAQDLNGNIVSVDTESDEQVLNEINDDIIIGDDEIQTQQ